MRWQPANDRELLVFLKHPNRKMNRIGWNAFFQIYKEALYRDARRSLLKRGVTDDLDQDIMTVIRETWLKVQANIEFFEFRHEGALYHYIRSFLAFEVFNLRHRRQRDQRRKARELSLDEAQERWGDTVENLILELINQYQASDDTIEVADEVSEPELTQLAGEVSIHLSPSDRKLLYERLVEGKEYADLAADRNITPNNARQKLFRAKYRFIVAFVAVVRKAYIEGRISYGSYRYLLNCVDDTDLRGSVTV